MTTTARASLLAVVIAVLAGACAGAMPSRSTTPPVSSQSSSASPTDSASRPASSGAVPASLEPPSGTPPDSAAGAGSVSNEGNGVTVSASWAGIGSGAVFEVALNTHSVDLDGLDLGDSVLRNDRGDELTGPTWSAPPGGHHRSGELRFAGDTQPFFTSAKWIELVLVGIAGVPERTLHWDVTS